MCVCVGPNEAANSDGLGLVTLGGMNDRRADVSLARPIGDKGG